MHFVYKKFHIIRGLWIDSVTRFRKVITHGFYLCTYDSFLRLRLYRNAVYCSLPPKTLCLTLHVLNGRPLCLYHANDQPYLTLIMPCRPLHHTRAYSLQNNRLFIMQWKSDISNNAKSDVEIRSRNKTQKKRCGKQNGTNFYMEIVREDIWIYTRP